MKAAYKKANGSINMGVGIVFAIFRRLNNREVNMMSYPDRLNLQKLTCMLQSAGLKLGYAFHWYVRGPYSVGLANESFEFYEKKAPYPHIPETEDRIVKSLEATLGNVLKDTDLLELYASLVFLKQENREMGMEDLANRLVYHKPWFTKIQASEAIKKLEEAKLLSWEPLATGV